METLQKMITIISWICTIVNPIFIILMIRKENKYKGSLEESMDRLRGYTTTYLKYNIKLFIIFVIAIVYLIAK